MIGSFARISMNAAALVLVQSLGGTVPAAADPPDAIPASYAESISLRQLECENLKWDLPQLSKPTLDIERWFVDPRMPDGTPVEGVTGVTEDGYLILETAIGTVVFDDMRSATPSIAVRNLFNSRIDTASQILIGVSGQLPLRLYWFLGRQECSYRALVCGVAVFIGNRPKEPVLHEYLACVSAMTTLSNGLPDLFVVDVENAEQPMPLVYTATFRFDGVRYREAERRYVGGLID